MLVCPLRNVERFRDMTSDEVSDMFLSVHIIAKALERHYGVTALSVGLQVCTYAVLFVAIYFDLLQS